MQPTNHLKTSKGALGNPDSGYSCHRRLPARQPVLAIGIIGRYVLPLPNDLAIYQGECGEDTDHRFGSPDYVGMGVLTIFTIALLVLNRQRIVKEEKAAKR